MSFETYTPETVEYFNRFQKEVEDVYALANNARAKGFDPIKQVEIPIALSMAEKVVGLISTVYPQMMNSGITERILDLEKEYGKLDPTVIFKIADEISDQKFCKFNSILEAMDAGVRVGLCYTTLGVVSSPIEGYTGLEVGKTRDGKEYIIANFSGPIRSAGTTASCMVLFLIDFLREKFGYAKYDPDENEVKRVWTELSDFHERITNLQYMPTEEESLFIAKNMPFQVSGDPSEKLEVSNYKNLPRVPTNFLRSGFCLVLAEGLAQKAPKGFRLYNMARKNGIKGTGFEWIQEYLEIHEKRTLGKSKSGGAPTYIKDLVAGRPIYGHPSRSGAFRFRYGRGRNSGFSATLLHPATMGITEDFIATGTQLKVEKPTKGCAVSVCDEIEGPIVKLKNGSVRQLKTKEEARELYNQVSEIIYLGDMLFPFSDVANRNSTLITPGYVEEWWYLELKEKSKEVAKGIDYRNISIEDAIDISKNQGIPFYPKYIYYWTEISKEEFFGLIDWLKHAWVDEKLIFPYTKEDKEKFSLGKRALELLGVPHEVTIENVVLSKVDSRALLINLGIENEFREKTFLKDLIDKRKFEKEGSVLEIVNEVANYVIKDKAGEFIGARMGRPEKAKLRSIPGSPNSLFVVGKEGGRMKTMQAAYQVGEVGFSYPLYWCNSCNQETIFNKCENCESETQKRYYFRDVKEKAFEKKVEYSENEGIPYQYRKIDFRHYFDKAREKIGMIKTDVPDVVKGIQTTSSGENINERIEKGLLRAKYGLQVFRDGTIRMDATELPIVAFKPKEIGTSVEKLINLGYTKDIDGNLLTNENQILEIKPHDILIPSSPETPDEKGEDVFMNLCNFVDELLVKFYGMEPFYKVNKREDLIGQLGVCMAPHNCAGVACRFIGFSNTLGIMASPYMHAAIRRDCDGDEAAIMLLGDVLLNFSRKFLPNRRGATQDAPLVMNVRIDAGEVDDQILDFEYLREYPLELYQLAEKKEHSSKVKVNMVRDILKRGEDPFIGVGYTHDTSNFNDGVVCSAYKLLEDMQKKVSRQMVLVEKIRAVDTQDTARLVIERHFIRDMRGNLRKFSMQGFRCVECNEISRRPPLSGKCPVCNGKLIFTIHEGGIKKYLEPALNLAKEFDLSPYLQQSLELTKGYIDSIFGKEKERQSGLNDYF
ncbi:DNA polymerase II large subunit [archaeon]|nr:DNA polymerase II large subunit [archaeon]